MYFRVGLASKGFNWEHVQSMHAFTSTLPPHRFSTVWADLNTTVSQLVRCVCSTVNELLEREGDVQ